MLGPYTAPLLAAVGLGGLLGLVAGTIRARGTAYEGTPVATLMGVLAGIVAGTTVFFFVLMFVSLLYLAGGGSNPVAVFALTALGQLLLFTLYVMRRR